MKKLPRKLKKQIPKGVYCYSPVEFPSSNNGYVYKVKPCKFYKHEAGLFGNCSLLNSEIMDQLKDCGIKDNF